MKNNFFASVLLTIICLFAACNPKQKAAETAQPDSVLNVSYAKGFEIAYFKDYKRVTVNDLSKNTVYARYYLVENESTETPADGQKIHTPIRSIAATSGTQFEFINLIGELGSITGVCSPQLIYNQMLSAAVRQGKVADLGDFLSLNIEKTQALRPDAVMVSGDFQESTLNKRLTEMGIPVIINNEWTEQSMLGRTEWIKFVAAFYDKEQVADSIFRATVKRYDAIKAKATTAAHRPKVLSGSNFKGTWYMPGGKSYMANLFADAHADYFYADNSAQKSLPLNFEVVLNNFKNADVWVGCPDNSLTELAAADERHKLFDAFRNKQAYNFNARTTPSGGNDFWEGAVAHPDAVLADMIKVFHPELLPEHEFVYVRRLAE